MIYSIQSIWGKLIESGKLWWVATRYSKRSGRR